MPLSLIPVLTCAARPAALPRCGTHTKARSIRRVSLRAEVAHAIFRGVFRELPPIETILLTVPAAAGEPAPHINGVFPRSSEPLGL